MKNSSYNLVTLVFLTFGGKIQLNVGGHKTPKHKSLAAIQVLFGFMWPYYALGAIRMHNLVFVGRNNQEMSGPCVQCHRYLVLGVVDPLLTQRAPICR